MAFNSPSAMGFLTIEGEMLGQGRVVYNTRNGMRGKVLDWRGDPTSVHSAAVRVSNVTTAGGDMSRSTNISIWKSDDLSLAPLNNPCTEVPKMDNKLTLPDDVKKGDVWTVEYNHPGQRDTFIVTGVSGKTVYLFNVLTFFQQRTDTRVINTTHKVHPQYKVGWVFLGGTDELFDYTI